VNVCKECGREWPPAAKFCPFDGVALGGDAPTAEGTPDETDLESKEKTVTDLIQAVSEPTVETPAIEVSTGTDDAGEKDTVVMEVPTFEKPAASPPPAPPEPEEELGKFSETSWFMAAADIEELDSDSETVSINEDRYKPAADLESEIRKQFSLREPDES